MMNLKGIMLSEITDREWQMLYDSLISGIQETKQMSKNSNTETEL